MRFMAPSSARMGGVQPELIVKHVDFLAGYRSARGLCAHPIDRYNAGTACADHQEEPGRSCDAELVRKIGDLVEALHVLRQDSICLSF
jgi:hypothetical protein